MYDSIFQVIFEDGSEFKGGDPVAPKWNKCSTEKKIQRLEILLPNEIDKIVLEGYERYNFFIGARKPMNNSEIIISHIYGLGCRKGIVCSYRITLTSSRTNKHKVGDITVRKFPIGKEGIGRTSTSGWREGVI